MSYIGICDKYGMSRVMVAAYAIPMPLSILANATFGSAGDFATASLFCGIFAGGSGYVAGALMHEAADFYLHKKHYGVSKGSAILQKVQALSYSFVAAVALAGSVSYMNDLDAEEQGGVKDTDPIEQKIKRDEPVTPLILKPVA